MSNSPLVNYTKRVTHHSGPRTHKIDTITIHHMAGNLSVETCAAVLQANNCSTNYGVGTDGRIALYVDEENRAWATTNDPNDQRAVNIEVANSAGAPDWPVSEKAYATLIELVADICRRNGIAKLVWGESKADRVGHKNGCNMTVHRDLMATACPGPHLMARMGDIAQKVNEKLGAADAQQSGGNDSNAESGAAKLPYTVRVSVTTLRIRAGAGTNYPSRGYIRPGVYTIVDEADGQGAKHWGKLKSGAGWIALDYVQKI